jgi:transcription termination factor Rho
MLEMMSDDERTETLLERLKKAKSNKDFLDSLKTA